MAHGETPAPRLSIQVAYAPQPREVDLVSLQVPDGCTVEQALRASGLLERHGLAIDASSSVGVWARLKPLDHILREGDRVEVYRPLKVDPKEARRQRYRGSGSKARGRAKAGAPSGGPGAPRDGGTT